MDPYKIDSKLISHLHSRDAELAVIGACILSDVALSNACAEITTQDFFFYSHKLIWDAIIDLYKKSGPIDLLCIRQELENHNRLEDVGGAVYLASLTDGVPYTSNIKEYIKILRNKTILRNILHFCEDAAARANAGDDEISEWAQFTFPKIFSDQEQETLTISEILSRVEKNAEEIHKTGGILVGVPFGLNCLDSYTGGMPRGATTIIGARPSMGKSSFCMNTAVKAGLTGYGVLYFSVEDSLETLGRRIICSDAKINANDLMRGRLNPDDFQKFSISKSKITKALFVGNETARTIEKIYAITRREAVQRKVDLIVVDYLQLLYGSNKESRNLQITEWSRDLKLLFKEVNAAGIVVSQLSRKCEEEKRKPQLQDLRESGALEQDADMVLFIHRPKEYEIGLDGGKLDARTGRLIELNISKNRNGPTGAFEKDVLFFPAYTLFVDADKRGFD